MYSLERFFEDYFSTDSVKTVPKVFHFYIEEQKKLRNFIENTLKLNVLIGVNQDLSVFFHHPSVEQFGVSR